MTETYAVINSVKYPVIMDKDGLAWKVADYGGPIEETWDDWSGGVGGTERPARKKY